MATGASGINRADRHADRIAARPRDAAVEIAKCIADAGYFCDTYLTIDDTQGHGQEAIGEMPFHLWPAQVPVMWKLMTLRLIIILKARQLGISWLCCAYALWLCLFTPGKMVLCFSQGQLEADELLRRINALYTRLPLWMREALPRMTKQNTENLQWSNGSRVLSLPATKSAGRSHTASLVLLDEAAFLQWAGALYTAVKPTIDAGGQLVVISTANGLGNLFHMLWSRAVAKANEFTAIFLPWWSRPGRTLAWYQRQLREAADPTKVLQEYPATATEAFIASGRARFMGTWIQNQAKNVSQPILLELLPEKLKSLATRCATGYNKLLVYKLPEEGHEYILAGDVAEGLGKGDYSAGLVIDRATWEEVACIHGHWEPDTFGDYLAELGSIYNTALVTPERNNHGFAVLAALKREPTSPYRLAVGPYPNIGLGMDERPGWDTNPKTKPMSIDYVAEALRDGLCAIRSQMILDELQIYEVKEDGKTGAPEGYFDDLVMALAIALAVARMPVIAPTVHELQMA